MVDSLAVLPSLLGGHIWWSEFTHFMQQGGPVLWCLFAVVLLFWLLVVERVIYLLMYYPKVKASWVSTWQARSEHHSWYAKSIRDGWIAQAHIGIYQNTNTIKLLVSLCPMLGLLGTVTGMISVFDSMALQGNNEPKLMASGIALATLPTMAGMVAALVGIFIHARLIKVCKTKAYQLEKELRIQQ